MKSTKGYKKLVDQKPSKSDYPKPHRKAILQVFHKQTPKPKPVIERPSKPLPDITKNPLVEAMENHYVLNTNMKALRKPIKIPKNYLDKLHDLDSIKRIIIAENRQLRHLERATDVKIELKYPSDLDLNSNPKIKTVHEKEQVKEARNDSVRVPYSDVQIAPLSEDGKSDEFIFAKHHIDVSMADSRRPSMDTSRLNISRCYLSSTNLSNTSLNDYKLARRGSRIPKLGDENLDKMESEQFSDPVSYLWQSKNLSYMLNLWQQAEGIELEPLISQLKQGFGDSKKLSSCSNSNSGSSRNLVAGNEARDKKPKNSKIGKGEKHRTRDQSGLHAYEIFRQKTSHERLKNGKIPQFKIGGNAPLVDDQECIMDLDREGPKLTAATAVEASPECANSSAIKKLDETNDSDQAMLSNESYSVLMRLSKQQFKQNPDIENKIRRVILGDGGDTIEPSLNLSIADVDIFKKPPTAPKSRAAMKKIVDHLISDDLTPVDMTKIEPLKHRPDSKSCLAFPVNLEEQRNYEKTSLEDFTKSQYDDTEQAEGFLIENFGISKPLTESSNFIVQSLKDHFGDNLVVPASHSGTPLTRLFTPIKVEGITKSERVPEDSKIYSAMRKLVYFIKNNISILPTENSNKGRSFWFWFIESDLARITKLPPVDHPDMDKITFAAKQCLNQDASIPLKYEACKFLIETGLCTSLGRWDAYQFNNTIKTMLMEGNDDQKDVVAVFFAIGGTIDSYVIEQLRKGLDSQNKERRQTSKIIFQNLDVKYAEFIIPIFLELAKKSNWRAKLDLIDMLRIWVPKLMPPKAKPPPIRDPDILDTDSEENIKALFYTLGTTTNLDDLSTSTKSESNLDLSNDFNLKNAEFFDQCVKCLLTMMFEDHNFNVRHEATRALNHLHQGKPVYDFIILMLSSNDPIKRSNGLIALSSLKVIAQEDMPKYLKTFNDPYSSVQINACKLAQVLKTNDPEVNSKLLQLLEHPDETVRAHSLKALGAIGCKSPKNREALNWAIAYDKHWSCRIEAIKACNSLNLIVEDQTIKDSIFTVLSVDKSDAVKREAEKVLLSNSLLFTNVLDDKKDNNFRQNHIQGPYPHIMNSHTNADVGIMLRDELIGQKELTDVVNELKVLGDKRRIMASVQDVILADDSSQTENDIDYNSILSLENNFKKLNSPIKTKINQVNKEFMAKQLKRASFHKVQALCSWN